MLHKYSSETVFFDLEEDSSKFENSDSFSSIHTEFEHADELNQTLKSCSKKDSGQNSRDYDHNNSSVLQLANDAVVAKQCNNESLENKPLEEAAVIEQCQVSLSLSSSSDSSSLPLVTSDKYISSEPDNEECLDATKSGNRETSQPAFEANSSENEKDEKLSTSSNKTSSKTSPSPINSEVFFRNLDTGEGRYIPVKSIDKALEQEKQFFMDLLQRSDFKENLKEDNVDEVTATSCDQQLSSQQQVNSSRGLRDYFQRHSLRQRKLVKPPTHDDISDNITEKFCSTTESVVGITPSQPVSVRENVRNLISRFRPKPTVQNESSVVMTSTAKLSETSVLPQENENVGVPKATATPQKVASAASEITPSRPWYEALRRGASEQPIKTPCRMKTSRSVTVKSKQFQTSFWFVKQLETTKAIPVWSLALSFDGSWIAAGLQDGVVSLWSINASSYETRKKKNKTTTSRVAEGSNMNNNDEKESLSQRVVSLNSTSPNSTSTKSPGYETVDLSSTESPENNNCNENSLIIETSVLEKRGFQQQQSCTVKNDDSDFIMECLPKLNCVGHSAPVISCQWDTKPMVTNNNKKYNRLASASLDKTVRVWIIWDSCIIASSSSLLETPYLVVECVDWVTAVCFHPVSKELLYTASLNGTIQVWKIDLELNVNITDDESSERFHKKSFADLLKFMRMTELSTTMSISPNGKLVAVGLRSGRVCMYEALTLRFCSEVDCRNRRGRYSNGRKVTGICWSSNSASICVSTSDSRIRVIHLRDTSLWSKYKGHVNNKMMLYAQFSPLETHIICASESSCIFVWEKDSFSKFQDTLVVSRSTIIKHKRKPTCCSAETFKAFNELLTSCVVGNIQFQTKITKAILNATTTEGSSFAELQSCLASSERLTKSLHRLVVVAGSHSGRIRIFINAEE